MVFNLTKNISNWNFMEIGTKAIKFGDRWAFMTQEVLENKSRKERIQSLMPKKIEQMKLRDKYKIETTWK